MHIETIEFISEDDVTTYIELRREDGLPYIEIICGPMSFTFGVDSGFITDKIRALASSLRNMADFIDNSNNRNNV